MCGREEGCKGGRGGIGGLNNFLAPTKEAAFYEDYAEDLQHGFQFLAHNIF